MRLTILQEYANLSFFLPLVSVMTKENPKDRPTISEAISMFNKIVEAQRPYQLRWRVQRAEHGLVRKMYTNLHSVARECGRLLSTSTFLDLPESP